jgi:phosphoribosylformylglycinamidine synthase
MIPCISGKDSMKNDYMIADHRISIPPTVLFSVIGSIEDARTAVTMEVKRPGDAVYVLGMTRHELGGSEYYALHGHIGSSVPRVDAPAALRLYRALHEAIRGGLVASCHDCSDGGLGVALAESAFSGGRGMQVQLARVPVSGALRDDAVLFSETQSRFVVTVPPEKAPRFEACMRDSCCAAIGTVLDGPRFIVQGLQGGVVIDTDIFELKRAWQATLLQY